MIAVKHGGATTLENLVYACFQCNRYKGSDLSSIDPETNLITPLFNPRTQRWEENFRLEGALIVPSTPEARVTLVLLHLNDAARIEERRVLLVQE